MSLTESRMPSAGFDERALMSRIRWRLVPYIMILYIIAMLDRVNVGFAALQMNQDLGIDARGFGMIAGIFFIAYFFFEVPSNVIMHRVGARAWITRILVSWGIVTILTGFVQSITQLAILRFLLGVCEAGFYPCIILYFTFWFPHKHLAKTMAGFVTGMAIANIICGPISAWIIDHVNWYGLAGWRWMFILEGIPAVLFGVVNLFIMIDRPEQAAYITAEEKVWLTAELKREHEAKSARLSVSKWAVFGVGRVWHLAFCYFCLVVTTYGLGMWMPQILRALSDVLTNTQIGFISALPYICAMVAMVLVARHSDKTGERRLHVALSIFVGFFSFIGLTLTSNLWVSLALMCISTAAIYSFVGTFWTLPTMFLSEATAAVGIAIINSTGNLGGFIGPYAVGYIKDATGSTSGGMYFLAAFALLATVSVLAIPVKDAQHEG